MDIGVPKERRPFEFRVGLTPSSVRTLTSIGHRIYIEKDAGEPAGFINEFYEQAGAIIVYDEEEIYGRPDLLIKFARPMYSELQMMKEGLILMGFLYLHATKRDKIEIIYDKKITAIGLELLQDGDQFPILAAISSLAGQVLPSIASQHLNNLNGGPGVILGGAPGIPPAEVVIIGCGNAGFEIARNFIQIGAQVTVLDRDPNKLRRLHNSLGLGSRVVTMLSTDSTIEKVVKYADVLIVAIQVPGKRSPIIVTEEMVKKMKKRSVLIDLSIDQGGSVETSRLTSHKSPTFVKHGVIHYCVPNLSSIVARTASHAYNNALRPYLCNIANIKDVKDLVSHPVLKSAIVTYKGEVSHVSLQKKVDSSVSIEETLGQSNI